MALRKSSGVLHRAFFRSVAKPPGFPISRFSRRYVLSTQQTHSEPPYRSNACCSVNRGDPFPIACPPHEESTWKMVYNNWFSVENPTRRVAFCIIGSGYDVSQTVMIEVRDKCLSAVADSVGGSSPSPSEKFVDWGRLIATRGGWNCQGRLGAISVLPQVNWHEFLLRHVNKIE